MERDKRQFQDLADRARRAANKPAADLAKKKRPIDRMAIPAIPKKRL